MNRFFNQPYDLLERNNFRHIFVFGGITFAFFFMWVFEPFGLYNLSPITQKVKVIGLYLGCGLLLMILQFYILQDIVIKKHTVLKTIIWILLSFVILGLSTSTINDILFNNSAFSISSIIYFQGVILTLNIIPVSFFILLHYSWTLKKRLNRASQINSRIESQQSKIIENKKVVINSENKKERFEISLSKLLFVTSLDNYIEIYIWDNDSLQKKILRNSLIKLEQDNSGIDEIFRCHKSYIINKAKIESIIGNAAGYKLKLYDYDMLIPVSRKWNKDIQEVIIN